MSNSPLLVTGATGKTGSFVVQQLLERGFRVRALAHRTDERSERLARLGAEVVSGDLHDLESLRVALAGVQRAYFCYPPHLEHLVEATANFAIAARDAGVTAVVNMSQIVAREDSNSPLSRQHWIAENVLDWADVGAVHVRPTLFAENLIIFGSHSITEEGKLYLPYGEELHAPVAAEDIARVVVAVLADPERHAGERYVLTGPANLTVAEMAEIVGEELGRPVEYVDLPIDAWGELLVSRVGLPEFLVTHLKVVAQDHQDGRFHAQTDAVERIGGRRPQDLGEFVRKNAELFTSPGALLNV